MTEPQSWDDALLLVPEYMRPGIILYIEDGIIPGGFLEAVFANDFLRACQMADETNKQLIHRYGELLLYCPSQAYGSYRNVQLWNKMGGMNGAKRNANG